MAEGPQRAGWLLRLALAAALMGVPGLAAAQMDNPWRAQGSSQPRFAPAEPQPMAPLAPPASTFAPLDLEQQLSGVRTPEPPRAAPSAAAPEPEEAPRSRTATTQQRTPQAAVPPVAGAVVPPYAGLPYAGGYGYGYVPGQPMQPSNNTTIVVPYGGGYPGGYGYPGYGGYPGSSRYGGSTWGDRRSGSDFWDGFNPNGFGFPLGGMSPFGFW